MRRFAFLLMAVILGAGGYFIYRGLSGSKVPHPLEGDLAGGQSASMAPGAKAKEIVDKYLQALGGTKVLQGIVDRSLTFRNVKYKAIPFSDGSPRSVQFPLLQEVYEDGNLDTSREFTTVKINSGLKDALFERPEGAAFKGAVEDGS